MIDGTVFYRDTCHHPTGAQAKIVGAADTDLTTDQVRVFEAEL